MKHPDDTLVTPIYVKTQADMPWPDDEKAFHVLGSNGLFLCRNHPFFRSCVPASAWPSELAEQKTFIELHYPKIPRRRFEVIVGFFARVAELHRSEAAVLLAWDSSVQRLRLVVPEQTATVSRNWWGDVYPIGLHYQVPTDLPAGWTIIGDVHSHVDEPAYASGTDKDDETHRAGLHVVVGRISREPPDIHIAAVVDGQRFRVEPTAVLAGYRQRRLRFPSAWLERVKVEPHSWKKSWSSSSHSSSSTAIVRQDRERDATPAVEDDNRNGDREDRA
jgi:hypothetical protein